MPTCMARAYRVTREQTKVLLEATLISGTGANQDRAVGYAGRLGPGVVAQRDLAGPLPGRFVHRRQSVCRLAGLGYGDDQRAVIQNWVPVPELRGVVGLGGDPRQRLHPGSTEQCGVQAGPHAQQHDPIEAGDDLVGVRDLFQVDVRRIEGDAAPESVDDRLRLLVHLLEHEVLVLSLGDEQGVVGRRRGKLPHRCSVQEAVAGAAPGDGHHLAAGQVRYLPRVREQGGKVAG